MSASFVTHRLTTSGVDLDALLQTEWLLTNGTGSYAMGTAAGVNTRRYHGLLVAAGAWPGSQPPAGRAVLLNQMWEQLILHRADGTHGIEQTLEFSALAFRDPAGQRVFAPRGHTMLEQVERGLSIRWKYRWGDIGFERHALLHWKQPAVTLRYCVTGLDDAELTATLRLRPMVTLRDFHALRHQADQPRWEMDDHGGEYFTVREAGDHSPALTLQSSHGSFHRDEAAGDWWHRIFYPADAERGQEDSEDHYVPASLTTPVVDEVEVAVTAALGREPVEPVVDSADRADHLRPMVDRLAADHAANENVRETPAVDARSAQDHALPQPLPQKGGGFDGRRSSAKGTAGGPELRGVQHRLGKALVIAADDFVVDRRIAGESLSTVLAGYPWFLDWGRDTFISLPGLLLATGRFDEARATLRAFGDAIADGLVPNRFDDYDDKAAHYNTVDASLWYIRAAIQYVETTGDDKAWRNWLAAACLRIVDAYITGTKYGIVMDTDGLISAGGPDTQLTWMDAKCGDVVFTPRWGKAVEINALWHHALVALSEREPLPGGVGLERYARLAKKVRESFEATFWNERLGCLHDHVRVDASGQVVADESIRPNQVLAASLPHSPLSRDQSQRMLSVVREHLLTPMGLRTLSPTDEAYRGRYTGAQFERDGAYHQGTVWPWLIGPYAEAVLRVGEFSKAARDEAREVIRPLLDRLTEGSQSLGQLHEIHEADTLRPVGCMAQAWSVAEVLRIHRLLGDGG